MSTTRPPKNASRLSDDDVRTMRKRYARGDTLQSIGDSYDVTREYVRLLVHGEVAAFAHLPVPDYSKRPASRVTLTSSQRKRMRARYLAGEQRNALAAEYGISQRTARTVLDGLRQPKARSHWTDELVAEVREKHRLGVSNRELAEEYGAHESTISHIVNKRGRFQ
jgi:hypothetical protein